MPTPQPNMEVASTSYGDFTNTGTDYSVPPVSTDGPTGKKTEYTNTRWEQQLGYYKTIPELKTDIDAFVTWTIGKGFKADEITTLHLMTIRGNGRETFNRILENMSKVAKIGGDSYAEIIRDNDGRLINLKPLDPGTITIIANEKGVITGYRQTAKTGKEHSFKPEEIFHLCRNRTADEIHGESLIDAVEWIILARNEAMADYKQVMHRYVKPRIVFKLDTDNPTKIDEFKAKADAANDKGENLFIPMGAVEFELLSVPAASSMNPLAWIRELNNYFHQVTGVPQIITGGSGEMTEATAKILYLSFEQTVEQEQLYTEEQVLSQLNFKIDLEFPASIRNEMISDMGKEESMQAATPEDTSLTSAQPSGQQPLTPAGGQT